MKVDIADVQRLTVKPGDRIVVHVPERIDDRRAALHMKGLKEWLPDGVPVMILSGGATLAVVTP